MHLTYAKIPSHLGQQHLLVFLSASRRTKDIGILVNELLTDHGFLTHDTTEAFVASTPVRLFICNPLPVGRYLLLTALTFFGEQLVVAAHTVGFLFAGYVLTARQRLFAVEATEMLDMPVQAVRLCVFFCEDQLGRKG